MIKRDREREEIAELIELCWQNMFTISGKAHRQLACAQKLLRISEKTLDKTWLGRGDGRKFWLFQKS